MIRKAVLTDIPMVCNLAFQEFMYEHTWLTGTDYSLMSTNRTLSEAISGQIPSEFWVAEEEGRIVGFIFAQYVFFSTDRVRPVCHEVGWFVEPQARGKGHGFSLLNAVEQAAKERGATSVSVGIAFEDKGHGELLKKYISIGYVPFQLQAFKKIGGPDK